MPSCSAICLVMGGVISFFLPTGLSGLQTTATGGISASIRPLRIIPANSGVPKNTYFILFVLLTEVSGICSYDLRIVSRQGDLLRVERSGLTYPKLLSLSLRSEE